MTKGDLIEFVLRRVLGNQTPVNDLRASVNYPDAEIAVESALMKVSTMGRGALQGMGVLFSDLTLSGDTITLPYPTATGPTSIKSVKDACGKRYEGRMSVDENVLSDIVKPLSKPEWWLASSVITFTSTPGDGPYTVTYIPSFSYVSETDELMISNEFQVAIIEMAASIILTPGYRRQEKTANTTTDEPVIKQQ